MRKDIIRCHEEGFKYRQEHYPELFDLDFWRETEEYKLLLEYTDPADRVLEVGCLTGHFLLLLEQEGYTKLKGVEFVDDAVFWIYTHHPDSKISIIPAEFEDTRIIPENTKIVLFDVLEHVHNTCVFLTHTLNNLTPNGEVLIIVPKGDNYPSEGHVNFYPNTQCLEQLLDFYFDVIEIREIDDGKKLFARCKRMED